MKKQTTEFAIISEDGAITKVGRSTVVQPKTNFKGGSIKWFDDSKLIKKSKKSVASDG